MNGADLFEDGFPHGTVEGFNDGCRGGACPGATEFGMSCKRAKALSAGDIRYNRLVALGKTPAEIAAIVDGHDEAPTVAAPEIATSADVVVEEGSIIASGTITVDAGFAIPTAETPAEVSIAGSGTTATTSAGPTEPAQPPAAKPDSDATPAELLTTEKFTAGLTQRGRTFVLRGIREWARANGFPGVPTHGKIPQDALAAFDLAHPNGPIGAEVPPTQQTGRPRPAAPAGVEAHVAQLREIREWAQQNGYPGVTNLTITDEIRAAYDAAHAQPESEVVAESLDDVATVGAEIAAHMASIEEPAVEPSSAAEPVEPLSVSEFADGMEEMRDRVREGAEEESQPTVSETPRTLPPGGFVAVDPSGALVGFDPATGAISRFAESDAEDVRRQARALFQKATARWARGPEWEEVAVSQDVERARALAVRLEAENALLLQQIASAHRAVEITLRLHAQQQMDNEVVRAQLANMEDLARRRAAHIAFDRSTKVLARTRIEELEQQVADLEDDLAHARTSWWKRLAR